MARKFFYICAGMFLLALVLPVAAYSQVATLYTVEQLPNPSGGLADGYTLGTWGPFQAPQAPAALLFGTLPAAGAPASEVVVEQHVLQPGQEVPLPHFADGSTATESETFWTVHLWQATFGTAYGVNGRRDHYSPAQPGYAGDVVRVNFTGRAFEGSGLLNPSTEPFNTASNVIVMVTVVAVRTAAVTSSKQHSWGSVKARYQNTPGTTVTPGADNR
jgi:hypothetical protein